jgi:hypothetical protein
MDRDDLYRQLVAINGTELQAFWSRFNVQAVLHAGLLALFVGFGDRRAPLIEILIPLIGVILTMIWLAMNKTGYAWLTFWQDQMRNLEDGWTGIEDELKPFTRARRRQDGIRTASAGVVLIFLIAWAVLTIRAAIMLSAG